MYCNNCIKINPLPKCVEVGSEIILTGLNFPYNLNESIYGILHNVSSDLTLMFSLFIDGSGNIVTTNGEISSGFNLTEAYDFMNHSYKIEFVDVISLEPVTVNVNGTEGCCIEFKVIKGLVGSGEYLVSTNQCGDNIINP